MKQIRRLQLGLSLSIILFTVVAPGFALQLQTNLARKADDATAKTSFTAPQTATAEATASEAARKWRRELPVLPSLARGLDGILNLYGQRATQNAHVSSTNVKDPVT